MGTSDTTAPPDAAEGTLVSIGYEGQTVGDLVVQLLEQDVRVLVDVRLTPLSRKPGLSKTKLSEALAAVGIRYVHHRALGNPKDNRAGFRAGEPESRARYRQVLDSSAAHRRARPRVRTPGRRGSGAALLRARPRRMPPRHRGAPAVEGAPGRCCGARLEQSVLNLRAPDAEHGE